MSHQNDYLKHLKYNFDAVHNNKDLVQIEAVLYDDGMSQATEAAKWITDPKNLGINQDNTPMKIGIMTDEVIEHNNLPQVSSPIMFNKGNIPTPDGLFSYEIFGTTSDERRKQAAYIDLRKPFFHPYIFEALRNLNHNVDYVAAGKYSWKVANGKLIKIEEDAEDYDENATGIRWLIEHFRELKFEKNNSYIHNEYIDLVNIQDDNEIFITKFYVCPVFYRDANFSGHTQDIPEVNEFYKRIIQLVNALRSSSMSMFMNNTELNIQAALVSIRKFGQSLVEGKKGFLKQFVIGKTTVYAARNVITQPIYNNAQTPEDIMIDIFHSGFPIAACCSMAYPFIEKWILDFFAKEFETREKKQILLKKEDETFELAYAKIGDVMAMYNPAFIEKKIGQYMETYGNRFEPLTIPMMDGSMAYILFTGSPYSKDPLNPSAPSTARRAMTWTDLLYLACVNTLEFGGKMAYITRYPLVDYFGTFPSMMRITSTMNTAPMEVNGTKYPFYPIVKVGATQDEVSTMFSDTVVMDNMYLKGNGGDYDGDMTSEKACFSDEANDEAYDIMTDVKHFVSISGKLMRVMGNETLLTFYAMTRR